MLGRLYMLAVMVAGLAAQAESSLQVPYDLIFRTGVLNDLPPGAVLRYRQNFEGDREDRNGTVELSLESDSTARLMLRRDGKFRHIGDFPATVGNPLIMYFIETVARDVARYTGGSPFYIRNRIKEALIRPVKVENIRVKHIGTELSARHIWLRPFLEDSHRDRLGEFANLSIRISVSEKILGWYYALEAEISSVREGFPYRAAIQLESHKIP